MPQKGQSRHFRPEQTLARDRITKFVTGKLPFAAVRGGTALWPVKATRVPVMTVVSLARRLLLTCSHNAPTKHSAGQKCGMLQRFASQAGSNPSFAAECFLTLAHIAETSSALQPCHQALASRIDQQPSGDCGRKWHPSQSVRSWPSLRVV
jgi:hypothetical protein